MPNISRNIRVNITAFGAYPKGSVIPRYVAEFGHANGIEQYVKDGHLAETDEAVNCEIVKPPAPIAPTASGLVDENNSLRIEAKSNGDALKIAEERLEIAASQVETLKNELGTYVLEIDRLKALLESEREAHRQEMDAALEAATKPKN